MIELHRANVRRSGLTLATYGGVDTSSYQFISDYNADNNAESKMDE